MNLRFWGVRGSIPTPHADRLRYGGNTTCVEIGSRADSEAVLIDCGSGLRVLGEDLAHRPPLSRIHILLTHFHWDHIQGLPYFPPLFRSDVEFVFYTNRPPDKVRGLLQVQMAEPFFPVPFEAIPARAEFRHIECGRPFRAGPLTVEAVALNHPQGAVGYRLESSGTVSVFASDHEYGNLAIDAGLIRASRDADLLIMDAQYTPEEYAGKVGWGHSSYAHAAHAANAANVDRLVLFHHDPTHTDIFLDTMLAATQELFPRTQMASEGKALHVTHPVAPSPAEAITAAYPRPR
ncbi:MAG TPA: MBL fold metallo-hydrolase [Acidobacteriaceae bacterium]|jgi:phosphoribosyl 1,2-cyclic phosphodiesterase|nr:MBL fold metallo-hydrolase [Acidobacteriaceae bacterium]